MKYCHQMLVSNELGGAGKIALKLAQAFRERVSETCIWIPGGGPATAKAEAMGLLYRTYDPTKVFTSSRFRGVIWNLGFRRQLGSLQPGLIHVHSPFYYGALSVAFKISRLKSVVHVHLEHDQEGLRWALKRPPHVIVACAKFLAEHVRSVLPEKSRDTQRIVVVPNAVDTELFYPGDKAVAKAQLGAAPNLPLILMVANIAPHKGHATALRAAAMLKKRGISAQFWFAGVEREGRCEHTKRLKSLAQELGVDQQVKFLGERDDIAALLRASDFFLLPSTVEGLPLSVLEAQASKVPVLAAPTPGVREIIAHEKTGFLVRADDAPGYAQCLDRLFNNRELCADIAETSYSAVLQGHSWKSYRERIWDVYEGLLDD